MENVLTKAVISQKIAGVSMENYLADQLEQMEEKEVQKERMELKVKLYRQLNVRHRNIIDAYRVEHYFSNKGKQVI